MCCEECFYFMPDKNKHGAEGLCRRYPPTVFPFMRGKALAGAEPQLMIRMLHPVVKYDAWCGEFISVRPENLKLNLKMENSNGKGKRKE